MADSSQELDSAIMLVHGEIEALKAKYPEHELLRYAQTFDRTDVPLEFLTRFGGDNVRKDLRGTEFERAAMYANYYLALKSAVG